ncbi:MAG TPA: thiamine biosynthesis protein ThiC, partial [Ruminococcaceae bacterium]|nr:thiamine biosynthesis protein ThiC [Oscillospiraceae bacterium]
MKYHTQMEAAKAGIFTPQMEAVSKEEHIAPEKLMQRMAAGTIVIPANCHHKSLKPRGVGKGLRTKINVNLGISGDCRDYTCELAKAKMAWKYDAEAIMDLSDYGKTNKFRRQLLDLSPAMIGTVPVYDAVGYLEKDLKEIQAKDFLEVVRAHAEEGVDFMTIHAGINRKSIDSFERSGRKMNIVSRGGSLIYAWMKMTGNENPFFEYFDDLM